MTVDLDLLADYVDGLLEPPAQARVESLVHSDRGWATALDELRAALPSVTAALASVDAERMPYAILTASLQALAANPDGAAQPVNDKRDTTRPMAGRPPTARTRRRLSTLAFATFALVAVALVGCGFLLNTISHNSNDSAIPAAGKAAPQIASGSAGGFALKVLVSGTNYTPATLPKAFGTNVPSLATPDLDGKHIGTFSGPGPTRAPVPLGLDRLGSQVALDTCLDQVNAVLGGQATAVDYASFEGTPALIITVPDVHTVVAVGANCGAGGSGIDELARS